MPHVSVDNASLYFEEQGQGPPLVLVHGTGASAHAWDLVVADLAKNFRTIVYDRRGHQRSTGTPPPMKHYFEQHGEDLLVLLEKLDVPPAIILGWSAGSFAVLHAALSSRGRMTRLVLYEPPLHAKKHINWTMVKTFAAVGFNRALGRPGRAAEVFRKMVMAYSDGRNTHDGLSDELRRQFETDTQALLIELSAGTGEELSVATLQSGISIPVTLLSGELSPQMFISATQRLQGIFPEASTVVIPGANHLAQFDEPQAFVKAVFDACAQ